MSAKLLNNASNCLERVTDLYLANTEELDESTYDNAKIKNALNAVKGVSTELGQYMQEKKSAEMSERAKNYVMKTP